MAVGNSDVGSCSQAIAVEPEPPPQQVEGQTVGPLLSLPIRG